LAVAEATELDLDVVRYMLKAERPDRSTLERLVEIIEDPVEDLVRKDAQFAKLGLDAESLVGNPAAVVDVLTAHPALLQRPILVRGDRAIIGRPLSRVAPFLA
jgi:arsenate reductase (glutaredoxin)